MAATITVRGLDEAVYEVRNLSTTFKSRAREFCNDLGEVAKNEAQDRYSVWNVTVENIPGKKSISNTVKATSNRDLVANDGSVVGSLILISEFGAGMLAGDHEWASLVPEVYPGSFSEKYGSGEFARDKQWHFGGRVYTEIVPTRAMWHGATLSEMVADKIAAAVFSGIKAGGSK